MHVTESMQYLLNMAYSTPGGEALRIAVTRLYDNGDTETLRIMAMAAKLQKIEAKLDDVLR